MVDIHGDSQADAEAIAERYVDDGWTCQSSGPTDVTCTSPTNSASASSRRRDAGLGERPGCCQGDRLGAAVQLRRGRPARRPLSEYRRTPPASCSWIACAHVEQPRGRGWRGRTSSHCRVCRKETRPFGPGTSLRDRLRHGPATARRRPRHSRPGSAASPPHVKHVVFASCLTWSTRSAKRSMLVLRSCGRLREKRATFRELWTR